MSVQIKFCGLTRRADVEVAVDLGAEYVGVVFAGGPRRQSVDAATALFAGLSGADIVGVIGRDEAEALQALRTVPLGVLQLHGDPSPDAIQRARDAGARVVWGVLPVGEDGLDDSAPALFRVADAIVLDTRSASGLGGTGATFDWERTAAQIAPYRAGTRIVLAGGLRPDNVAAAIRALRPDVVDVSSGVEQAPGIKDPELMRRFAAAARGA